MGQDDHQLDLLFLSEGPLWPLDQGFKVHGYHTAMAALELGSRVGVACLSDTPDDAPRPLRKATLEWPIANAEARRWFDAGWGGTRPNAMFKLRCRVASHQGLDRPRLAGAVSLVERLRPKAIVGVGLHSAAILKGLGAIAKLTRSVRIWYAADELIYFGLTCLRREPFDLWPSRMRTMALHGAFETCFARGLEGAIGVSPRDTYLLRLVAGAQRTITLRNGVDLDYFRPAGELSDPAASMLNPPAASHSLAFWGRMDFEPNADAVCWFAAHVWPRLHARHPQATWQIAGKHPLASVRRLASIPGIEVLGEVADVRPIAMNAGVTILPMRCGGGIKNKLLEAAAMGRAIVASPRAVAGLDAPGEAPAWRTCSTPHQWVDTIEGLWTSTEAARQLGRNARAWVERHHRWSDVAAGLLNWIDHGLSKSRGLDGRKEPETWPGRPCTSP